MCLACSCMVCFAQVDSERTIKLGRSALEFKDYLLSIRYFSSAIQANPENAEPYFLRAFAKYNLEDYKGAEADCDSCLKRNRFIYDAYYLRGIIRHAMEKDTLALEDYKKVLVNNPDDQGVLHNSSIIYLQRKDSINFEKNIHRLQRFYPKYAPGYLIESSHKLQQKDTLNAIELIEKAKRLDALSAAPYRALASIYFDKKDYSRAFKELDRGIELDEGNKELYLLRGIVNFSRHHLKEALNDYGRAIELDPRNAIARLNRALLRNRIGDLNGALKDFDVVVTLAPENNIARYNRALVNKELGNLKSSLLDLNIILNRFPTFVPAILNRAEINRLLGHENQSKVDIYQASQLLQHKPRQNTPQTKQLAQNNQADDKDNGIRDEKDKNINKFKMLVHQSSVKNFAGLYDDGIRGKLQDREVSFEAEPPLHLSYYDFVGTDRVPFRIVDKSIQSYLENDTLPIQPKLTMYSPVLSSDMIAYHSHTIDSITMLPNKSSKEFYQLALDYQTIRDYDKAMIASKKALSQQAGPLFLLVNSNALYFKYLSNKIMLRQKLKKITNDSKDLIGQDTSLELETRRIRESQNDYLKEAILNTKALVEKCPNSVTAHYNLGTLLYLLGETQDAIEELSKALELSPHFASIYFNLALCYYNLGDLPKGDTFMSKAGSLGIPRAYAILKKMHSD